jgi:integrase/recombinase XerC
LLENALKYGPASGLVVRVTAAVESDSVWVTVEDNGPGIPASDLPHIFERFYRVHKDRSRDAGGTGLGLSIVKHIVQAHSGQVSVDSVLGKGAKERIVPVGEPAMRALAKWRDVRTTMAAPQSKALFVSQQGTPISVRSIQARMKDWAIRQGLPRHVHPHMLRHSFASHVLQSSGDLRAVQEMLGHASIASTQVYTHLDFQYLSKVYDAAHPRAKKKP